MKDVIKVLDDKIKIIKESMEYNKDYKLIDVLKQIEDRRKNIINGTFTPTERRYKIK